MTSATFQALDCHMWLGAAGQHRYRTSPPSQKRLSIGQFWSRSLWNVKGPLWDLFCLGCRLRREASTGTKVYMPFVIKGWGREGCEHHPQKSNPQQGLPLTFCKGLRKIRRRDPKQKISRLYSFHLCPPVVISGQPLKGKGPGSFT